MVQVMDFYLDGNGLITAEVHIRPRKSPIVQTSMFYPLNRESTQQQYVNFSERRAMLDNM